LRAGPTGARPRPAAKRLQPSPRPLYPNSGHTIAAVIEMLNLRRPRSLKVCALLDKPERRESDVNIHYRGFTIPNKFVFGYGLDLDEYHRNLRFIGVVDLDKYEPPF
jgi:hypoxanthine phosphoribosyltransferase